MPKDVLMMMVYNVSVPDGAVVVRNAFGLVEVIRLPDGRLMDLYAQVEVCDEHDSDPETACLVELREQWGVDLERRDPWESLGELLNEASANAEHQNL
ncbi:hypothetical protein [Deinococcus cellulosilyticus]|uniref:Uncharacterized protein n=1 Tax=Deinococcus cellulosilyticus (strain DSM 18568 / NBRC 106333 / KACC 11606 / 5516J-15) TaxID=1223518 RepID=A0A511NAT2_DEIC1|nr:hypothetical protein [Deinococcus cellulosilyticus]GEM49656.1 hypothetical protein DC3_52910 [Deinococcus cellulosilyticus NBRC 106333 = KACC 11606]